MTAAVHSAGVNSVAVHSAAVPRGRWNIWMIMVATVVISSLAIGSAWALWAPRSSPGSSGISAATTVAQGAAPMATVVGSTVTVTWAASTLVTGQAVSGYLVTRYNASNVAQTILTACNGTVVALTCAESNVPTGVWTYTVTPVFATNWRGLESAKSASVSTETVAPVNAFTVTGVVGGAVRSANTIFYRGIAAGSFTLTNAVTDAGSGPASSQTSALTGTTTGWSHTPSTVSTPTGGPYVSSPFSWAAGATSSPVEVVTGRDVAGNTAASTFTFVNDSTPPTAGSISYPAGAQSTPSIQITFASGTDVLSGITSRVLQRSYAPRTNGVCGTYNPFATIGGANPVSPYTDTAVGGGACYQYRYVVTDAVGNQDIAVSANVANFDYSSSIANRTGLTNYYRLGEASNTASVVDSKGTSPGVSAGGVTVGVTGALSGDSNTAMTFDGVNDYIQTPAPRQTTGTDFTGNDFSIEFWFKSTQTFGTGCTNWWQGARLVDAEVDGTNNDFGTALCGGRVIVGVGGTADTNLISAAGLNNGVWHHVVMTRTAATRVIQLYIDGALSGSATGTSAALLNTSAIISIGRSQVPDDYFAGTMDEIALYSIVLTPSQVLADYSLGTAAASDVAGPTGGTVAATGLVGTGAAYSTSVGLSIAFTAGTDPSGMAGSGYQLQRATATLTSTAGADGVCGTYGTYQLLATDPVSPRADTVTDQACYRYRYVVADTNGNSTTYTSGDVKVDTVAPPAPALTFSATTNAYWSAAAPTIVYYRPAATSGSFTVTALSVDPASGTASYVFPTFGTGWTLTPGTKGVYTYSWSAANPAAATGGSITATNNAGAASPGSPFTLTGDSVAPTASGISYADGATVATTTSVSFTTGTDAGSGIGTRLLQRASTTLTGTTCGTTFSAFATVTNGTNPTSPVTDSTPAGNCYKYQYLVSDNVGNAAAVATSASIVKVTQTYAASITGTPGIQSYFRLDETSASNTISSDSFTGTSQALITSRAGEVGATWTRFAGTGNAKISSANRAFRDGANASLYYASAVPSTADYSVEADLVVVSDLAGDSIGVLGRVDPAAITFYRASWERSDNTWNIWKSVNGAFSYLGGAPGTMTPGQTYRLRLDMAGTAIKLFVNGTQTVSVVDASITAAGRGGFYDGESGGTVVKSNLTGVHLDNFAITTNALAADSVGSNPGTYLNRPTAGVAGALTSGGTAVQFDGVDDYIQAPRGIGDDFSIEFWFKSTQGIGTGANWWNGAGLVDSDVVAAPANTADFGVSLRSDGKVVAGIGNPDVSVISTAGGYNNGAWHHVVFTRTRASGVLQLYVDGTLTGTATGNTLAATANPVIALGRISGSANYFAGTLDEVALYTTALSQATVSAHYANR